MCFAAYRNARKGTSFSDYTGSLEFARAAGAPVPRSRQRRMTAAQLVNVFGQTLRAEDTLLLRTATHIHLTMDSRQMRLVVRARLALSSLPPNFCTESDLEAHSHVEGLLHVQRMSCSLYQYHNHGFLQF